MSRLKKYDPIIEKYVKNYPDLINNKTALAQKIIDDAKYSFTSDYFRRFIRDYIERHSVDTSITPEKKPSPQTNIQYKDGIPDLDSIEIPSMSDEEPRYKIYKDFYYWEGKHNSFKISVEEADQLFYEYSKHGLNESSTQVRRKHNIEIKMWYSLKYHLSLYKDSHIISPYTLETTSDDKLQEVIRSRMEAKEKDKERVIIEEHNSALMKSYNKTIEDFKVKDIAIERMLDNVIENLEIPEIKLIQRDPVDNAWNPNHVMIILADLHVGAEAKNLLATPDYNYQILRNALKKIAVEINAMNAAEISVMFLGDLIESLTGLNHLSSWHSIEDGAWGASVFEMAVEATIEFLNQIENLTEVFGIGGNHDRTDHDKKIDPYGSVAGMIFYMLRKIYSDTIPINYHYLMQSIQRDNINYIITHGDKPIVKKKTDGAEGVLQYGRPGIFNFVLQGHLHSRATIADHNKYRWLQCPSVFSGNTYSENNGFHALPGFLAIYTNPRTNQPVVMDYSI